MFQLQEAAMFETRGNSINFDLAAGDIRGTRPVSPPLGAKRRLNTSPPHQFSRLVVK